MLNVHQRLQCSVLQVKHDLLALHTVLWQSIEIYRMEITYIFRVHLVEPLMHFRHCQMHHHWTLPGTQGHCQNRHPEY